MCKKEMFLRGIRRKPEYDQKYFFIVKALLINL